jgi:hypothetical protein
MDLESIHVDIRDDNLVHGTVDSPVLIPARCQSVRPNQWMDRTGLDHPTVRYEYEFGVKTRPTRSSCIYIYFIYIYTYIIYI